MHQLVNKKNSVHLLVCIIWLYYNVQYKKH